MVSDDARGNEVRITRKPFACFVVSRVREFPMAEGEALLIRGNRLEAGVADGGTGSVAKIREDAGKASGLAGTARGGQSMSR